MASPGFSNVRHCSFTSRQKGVAQPKEEASPNLGILLEGNDPVSDRTLETLGLSLGPLLDSLFLGGVKAVFFTIKVHVFL